MKKQRDEMEILHLPLYILKTEEEGHELRNVGRLYNL